MGSPPDFAPENATTIADFNNIIRELQAAIRRDYENPDWRDLGHVPSLVSATVLSVPGDQTAFYVINQRIRVTDSTTLYGTIVSVVFGAATNITIIFDSGALSVPTVVSVGVNPVGTPVGFPSGTKLLFNQATAPVGWTKEIAAIYDQATPRVVTTFVGSGGSVPFTTVFSSTTPTTISAGHNHNVSGNTDANTLTSQTGASGSNKTFTAIPHTHTMNINTSTNGSHSHTSNLAVRYVDFIVCTKN